MSSADRVRALARNQEDEAEPHPDEGLILSSDRVSAARGISQTSQVTSSHTGIAQGHGQTLVSTIVVNPQSIAAGNAYHLTVPPRYVELGDMRQAMNLSGTYSKGALEARAAYMERFYPEIGDNNWRDQCNEIASQTNFADFSMARRLILIQQQEAAEDNETTCPLFTWTWSNALGGPTPYCQSTSPAAWARLFFRGPYDPDCVWNLAENTITSLGQASLLSILNIANALRSMNIGDQTASCSRCPGSYRLLEVRCQELFSGLIDAQRNGREEGAQKKKARREREEMRLELTAAQADIAKAASTLASVRQQYFEQHEELHDDKIALGVLLDDERSANYDLRQNLKKAEAAVAYLNTKLAALESGARDKIAVRNDLQMKLTAAATAEATSMSKWDAERQQLRARSVSPSKSATKPLRPSAVLRRRRTSISCGGPKEPGSPGTAIQADGRRTRAVPATACSADLRERIHQPDSPSAAPGQKALGSDTPMSPLAGTSTHRGSRDKQPDEAGTAITAIAQSMLTGPRVTSSSAHLTSEQVAKWVQHQRTQLEARTFDARTLTTTISERFWTMIGFKIAFSRTLHENPTNDWRKEWNMDTFLKALEEVYSLHGDRLHLASHRSRPMQELGGGPSGHEHAVREVRSLPGGTYCTHSLQGLQVQQDFPRRIPTSFGRRPGLPEERQHRPVPPAL